MTYMKKWKAREIAIECNNRKDIVDLMYYLEQFNMVDNYYLNREFEYEEYQRGICISYRGDRDYVWADTECEVNYERRPLVSVQEFISEKIEIDNDKLLSLIY